MLLAMFILKVDKYHEPEYYGFDSKEALDEYVEAYILSRVVKHERQDRPYRPVLRYLQEKKYGAAMCEWGDVAGEYLSMLSPRTVSREKCRAEIEALRVKTEALYPKG